MELGSLPSWLIIAYPIGLVINLILAILFIKYSENDITVGDLLIIIFLVLASFLSLGAILLNCMVDFLCEHVNKVVWKKQKRPLK